MLCKSINFKKSESVFRDFHLCMYAFGFGFCFPGFWSIPYNAQVSFLALYWKFSPGEVQRTICSARYWIRIWQIKTSIISTFPAIPSLWPFVWSVLSLVQLVVTNLELKHALSVSLAPQLSISNKLPYFTS